VIGIYNSGFGDQTNPSSVEPTAGTLAYNAKTYGSVESHGVSPNGDTLWILQSHPPTTDTGLLKTGAGPVL
jgi:hypothetical protein